MNKIVLISCVSKKLNKPSAAKDLYVSTLFKLNLQYARKMEPDGIFILSALYGLVSLNQIISPYDVTLNNMKVEARKQWADRVINQLDEAVPISDSHFVFLAGEKYRQYLVAQLPFYEVPLQGMRIGEQLQFLKRQTS
jgi:hypothetical protein